MREAGREVAQTLEALPPRLPATHRSSFRFASLPDTPTPRPLPPLPPAAPQLFTTGTAVVVSPVGSLTYKGGRRQYAEDGQPGSVALELYDQLTGLQQERYPDPFGWVVPVC